MFLKYTHCVRLLRKSKTVICSPGALHTYHATLVNPVVCIIIYIIMKCNIRTYHWSHGNHRDDGGVQYIVGFRAKFETVGNVIVFFFDNITTRHSYGRYYRHNYNIILVLVLNINTVVVGTSNATISKSDE